MDDQPERPPESYLESYYAGVAAKVRRRVASAYPLEICLPSSPDYPKPASRWREVWRVYSSVPGDEGDELLLAIPTAFPDELPVAYLPVGAVPAGIPHLDRKRLLCTFDATETAPNSDRSEDMALAVIARAWQVWQSGASGANTGDYADEFSAYWAQEIGSACLSLVRIDGCPREVTQIAVSPPWNVFGAMFAESEDPGKRWLASVGYTGQTSARPALYLPLEDLGLPPYPATNGELYDLLNRRSPQSLSLLLKFLRRHTGRPAPVLFSVESGDGRAAGAWRHPRFAPSFTVSGPNGFRNVRGVRGFRPGSHPVALELDVLNRDEPLEKLAVSRVERERLTERTSGHPAEQWNGPVNAVGCGSLGGFIADGLARSGRPGSLRLVDPEVLSPENTLRHCCGMSEIFQPKAEAVGRKILRAFPHMRCEPVRENVLDLLRLQPACLADGAMTVAAIGNLAAERRLNALSRSAGHPLTRYLCFTWVEPYMYGGHALLLRADRPGCLECLLDESLVFRHRILTDPARHLKREAGCQSSYTPYGGADLTTFAAAVTRWLAGSGETDAPALLSWTGDLQRAAAEGIPIAAEYMGMQPFSLTVRTVTPNPDCLVCGYA